ncbi:hypothetical protein F4804DRAFT_351692 [Jackrogersella minutella]|nr:hypothetical protein F4804DRAFT_351692 [Jackrogersella minutella]
MATKENADVKRSFNWLRREARGPTYISFSPFSDRSACSFDFGDNGSAASCNYGGELLQMSAKDDEKGVVFAHGDFERTYYSSLARAQRKHGGQATFGLELATNQKPFENTKPEEQLKERKDRGSNLKLGQMTERGCFNYRWPFNEYVLLLNEEDGIEPKEAGTCTRVSFVKDDILYQVIRLENGSRVESNTSIYVRWRGQVALSIGGLIKFGELSPDAPYTEPSERLVNSDSVSIIGSTNQLDIRIQQLNGDKYDTLPLSLPGDQESCNAGRNVGPYHAYADLPGTNVSFRDRQVTFVAEFRLRQCGREPKWPNTPTSEDIYGYLGIDSCSNMATGMMWETLFLQREDKSNYFSELSEVNLVGRCVEKIMTVDLVPVTIRENGCIKFEKEGPLAPVSNLFLRPNIDLESMFWKIRFLTKAYRFLYSFIDAYTGSESSKSSEEDSSDDSDIPTSRYTSKVEPSRYTAKSAWNQVNIIKGTVEFQMGRLRRNIERVLSYLVRTLIQPGTTTNLPPLAAKTFQSNYYYVMITIWYVAKRCEPFKEAFKFAWEWVDEMDKWSTEDCILACCLPPDNVLLKGKEREQVTFLKWYHYASLWNLATRKTVRLLPTSWQTEDLDMKVNLLERDARRAAAAKLSSRHAYSPDDEILDRLGFLAEPLNAEFSRHRADSVALITAKRILKRDSTRYLNPGRLRDGEKGPTSGPWEVHALCHHSRLLVENYQYSKSDDKTREQKAEDAANLPHPMLGKDKHSFIPVGSHKYIGFYSFVYLPERLPIRRGKIK